MISAGSVLTLNSKRPILYGLRLQGQPEGPHPLQSLVLAVAVDDPEPRPPPADEIVPADHIAAAVHAQIPIKADHIFFKAF